MEIVEITENHEFKVLHEIRTNEIYVTIGQTRKSLFELLSLYKEKLKCNFTF